MGIKYIYLVKVLMKFYLIMEYKAKKYTIIVNLVVIFHLILLKYSHGEVFMAEHNIAI